MSLQDITGKTLAQRVTELEIAFRQESDQAFAKAPGRECDVIILMQEEAMRRPRTAATDALRAELGIAYPIHPSADELARLSRKLYTVHGLGTALVSDLGEAVFYRLSDAWLAYCQALKVQVSDVLELAGQGSLVEAYRHLSERLAGTGTDASRTARPQGAPFVVVAPVPTSAQGAAPLTVGQAEASGAPAQSTASGVPTAGFALAAGGLALRGQSVSASKTGRRFRPLVRSSSLLARSFKAPSISMQIFVLNSKTAWPLEDFQNE